MLGLTGTSGRGASLIQVKLVDQMISIAHLYQKDLDID